MTKKPRHFIPPTLAVCLALANNVPAQAQTGLLNDTGQTSCYDTNNNAVVCDISTTGNASALPHQDGRYGRDAAQAAGALPTKTGGGDAGFDYSCVLWNGTVVNSPSCTSTLVANTTGTASGTPATDWACTKDNVTGLVWSLQTQGPVDWNTASTASYANAGHNSASRCGYGSGWRLPTRMELAGLAHHGKVGPAIDLAYFPGTQSQHFWASEVSAKYPTRAWGLEFLNGQFMTDDKTNTNIVRLVRSVP